MCVCATANHTKRFLYASKGIEVQGLLHYICVTVDAKSNRQYPNHIFRQTKIDSQLVAYVQDHHIYVSEYDVCKPMKFMGNTAPFLYSTDRGQQRFSAVAIHI